MPRLLLAPAALLCTAIWAAAAVAGGVLPAPASGCALSGCTFSGALNTTSTINNWTPKFFAQDSSAGAPAAAGSGYSTGDLVTTSGGNILSVTASGGAVTGFYVMTPAAGVSTVPTQPETQASTTGSGTGATFPITYGPYSLTQSQPPFGNSGINGLTRLGWHACFQVNNNSLGPTCLGYYSGGAGLNDDIGMGGGTGMTGGQESTFTGSLSGSQMTTGYWITATGHNTAGHETDGIQSEYYGTDSGKYALHNSNVSGYGTNTLKFIWNAVQDVAVGATTFSGEALQPTITAIANNGSGLYRLTVSSTAGMTTNDAVFITGVGGNGSINTTGTPYYINVVDGTHLDLQGTTYAAGNTASGRVSDLPAGVINMAVTGTQSNGGAVQLLVDNTVNLRVAGGTGLHVAGVAGTTEANGTWAYSTQDADCNTGSCRVTLIGSTYTNAWTSGGRATALQGPIGVTVVGQNSLSSSALTGHLDSLTILGQQTAVAAVSLGHSTILGAQVAPVLLGSTGGNTGIILVGVDSTTDVASGSVVNSVGIGQNMKLANSSVQIGYRAGFVNNINSSAIRDVLVGHGTGFSMNGPVQVTAMGDSVGGTTCQSPVNVLLLGTTGGVSGTDCISANETNAIHIGAGGADIIYATGTGTPSTSVLTIAGKLKMGAAFAANGSVATSLTSVGPTGANTTVQEWMQVTNSAGTVRYIPLF